ncbi:MAG: NAD-dependent epimerase/dehydratase family protein [Verrucomicrobia bacterium]|nr:NAD-dependent epimerase/dehydratase family protein [Verrucomicrobiota bacterium]
MARAPILRDAAPNSELRTPNSELHSAPDTRHSQHALVIGPGFVGGLLARRLGELGFRVTALTKSVESAARLAATEPFLTCAADISRPEAFAGLPEHSYSIVFHCASSGRGGAPEYRAVFLEGTRNILQCLSCGHLVFCSSTSVYGQQDGLTVDEAAPAEPERETGRILLEAERLVLSHGGTVARLAGLYGPGRCIPLDKLFDGTAVLEGAGERLLNNLHQVDAAGALIYLAQRAAGGLYNVVDNEPVRQREWFAWVCARLNRPLPPFGPRDFNRKRAWTNKAVSNGKLRAAGWQPVYPSFREGLAELIASAGCRVEFGARRL